MRRTLLAPPFLLFLALLPLFPACSRNLAKRTDLTAADLHSGGMQRFAKKDYKDAIEYFQAFLERFPTSPLAPEVQLSLADARMERREVPEAEAAFDDFLRLYPSSDNVPYALYRKGELLSRDVADPGRDQTRTREAIATLRTLLARQPDGPLAAPAKERIRQLEDRLAAHEALVVGHYLRRKRYESAETRARHALQEFPGTRETPRILSQLAEALDRQGKEAEAAAARALLSEKFPRSGGGKR